MMIFQAIHEFLHKQDTTSVEEVLDNIILLGEKLDLLIERINEMQGDLDTLRAAVERNTTVDQSAVTLIQGMKTQLDQLLQNATDLDTLRAGVQELSSSLDASTTSLADAVSANTPAAGGGPAPTP